MISTTSPLIIVLLCLLTANQSWAHGQKTSSASSPHPQTVGHNTPPNFAHLSNEALENGRKILQDLAESHRQQLSINFTIEGMDKHNNALYYLRQVAEELKRRKGRFIHDEDNDLQHLTFADLGNNTKAAINNEGTAWKEKEPLEVKFKHLHEIFQEVLKEEPLDIGTLERLSVELNAAHRNLDPHYENHSEAQAILSKHMAEVQYRLLSLESIPRLEHRKTVLKNAIVHYKRLASDLRGFPNVAEKYHNMIGELEKHLNFTEVALRRVQPE